MCCAVKYDSRDTRTYNVLVLALYPKPEPRSFSFVGHPSLASLTFVVVLYLDIVEKRTTPSIESCFDQLEKAIQEELLPALLEKPLTTAIND